MAKLESEIKVRVSSKSALRKIQKATNAVNKLKKALGDLKEIEINLEVVTIEKKWWKFWE